MHATVVIKSNHRVKKRFESSYVLEAPFGSGLSLPQFVHRLERLGALLESFNLLLIVGGVSSSTGPQVVREKEHQQALLVNDAKLAQMILEQGLLDRGDE